MVVVLDDTAHFTLTFSPPNLSLVSVVRRFVTEFYSRILSNNEATSLLAVATHELLDNAVVHSSDGDAKIRVGVHAAGAGVHAQIETTNRCSKENLEAARRALDEIAATKDPNAYFLSKMRESAKRTDGSGLGLARVRAESEMMLEYQIDGDQLRLRATAIFAGDIKR